MLIKTCWTQAACQYSLQYVRNTHLRLKLKVLVDMVIPKLITETIEEVAILFTLFMKVFHRSSASGSV